MCWPFVGMLTRSVIAIGLHNSHSTEEQLESRGQRKQKTRVGFLDITLLNPPVVVPPTGRRETGDKFNKAVAVASCNSCIPAAQEAISSFQSHCSQHVSNSLWHNPHCESRCVILQSSLMLQLKYLHLCRHPDLCEKYETIPELPAHVFRPWFS